MRPPHGSWAACHSRNVAPSMARTFAGTACMYSWKMPCRSCLDFGRRPMSRAFARSLPSRRYSVCGWYGKNPASRAARTIVAVGIQAQEHPLRAPTRPMPASMRLNREETTAAVVVGVDQRLHLPGGALSPRTGVNQTANRSAAARSRRCACRWRRRTTAPALPPGAGRARQAPIRSQGFASFGYTRPSKDTSATRSVGSGRRARLIWSWSFSSLSAPSRRSRRGTGCRSSVRGGTTTPGMCPVPPLRVGLRWSARFAPWPAPLRRRPRVSTTGARINTAWNGSPPSAGISRSASKLSTWRP